MSASDGKRFRGGLSSAYTNLRRQWFLDPERSGNFAPIFKVLDDFAKRNERVLGATEQIDSEALLICELRARKGLLEQLFAEMP
jgi:hypothetical protein